MDMNLGSGSQMLGGANDALQQAMSRRQSGDMGQSQMASPASASFDPSLQQQQMSSPGMPQPTGAPSQGAMLGAPSAQLNTAMENDLIIKALSTKLKQNTELEHSQAGVVKGGA